MRIGSSRRFRPARLLCALMMVLGLVAPGPAAGPARAVDEDVDLRYDAAIEIVGATKVARGGDINGDGIPDVIVSKGGKVDDPERGRSWVVFGRSEPGVIHLDDLGDAGFAIEGANNEDWASEIASAGDVNGDGLADVLVGAAGADNRGMSNSGSVYVVFGKASSAPVELSLFNANAQGLTGFRIDGAFIGDLAGEDVAGVGDINGDGLDDIGIGAPFAGSFYVVFGKIDTAPVDLASFHASESTPLGFRIFGKNVNSSDATSIASAGDANADGVPDVVVGSIPRNGARGDAYVVFGRSDPSRVDLRELDGKGYRIRGYFGGSYLGFVSAGAGDVNGDGKDDVIIGAPGLCCTFGDAWVVFGKKDSRLVKLRQLGDKGFWIHSGSRRGGVGFSLDAPGDLNGDGLADLLVGAPETTAKKRASAGVVYAIYGKRSSRWIRLDRSRWRGFRIVGARSSDEVWKTAGVGDMNADGRPDVAVSAYKEPGRVYIVWGR